MAQYAEDQTDELTPRFKFAVLIVLVLTIVGIVLQVGLTYFPPPGGPESAAAGQLHDFAAFLTQSGFGALVGLIVGKAA